MPSNPGRTGSPADPASGRPAAMAEPERILDDVDLVDRVRAGDATAYRGLVERYQNRVYGLVYGMVRDREEARDLTQEAFVKAYRNLSGFRQDASFHTWLFRIAMNVAIDHIRKHRRIRTSEYDDALDHDDEGLDTWEADHLRRSPARDHERQHLYDRIMAALQHLSPEHRQAILLREIEGLSYKEIADAMDIPEGTVMSRLFYARKRLQELLEDLR
ncbi:MAG: sigma-70 family RNA polymerase sigma factor [Deltaproteobacteria bacterium]|nr:sigma-70 family RNA polymerase sigma factor [Deltaproteobacteria bacterium]